MILLGTSYGLRPRLAVDLGLHLVGSLRDGIGVGRGPCEEVTYRSTEEGLKAFADDLCGLKGTVCSRVEHPLVPGCDQGCFFPENGARRRVRGGGVDLCSQSEVSERGPPTEKIGPMGQVFFEKADAFIETLLDDG